MIMTEAEARVALGLTSSITALERAILTNLLPKVDAAIIKELRYDPQYQVISDGEWYPANYGPVGDGEGYWDVAGDRAHFAEYGCTEILQLRNLPVRSIEEIRVDYNGGFGQKAGTFGDGTIFVQGDDWWLDLIKPYFCATGQVYSATTWPRNPGSILVKYTSGYTQLELSGRADSGTDPETLRAVSRINASGIKTAAELTTVKAFKQIALNAKQRLAGFVAGPMSSERLGGYSYSAGGAVAEAMAGMKIAVPAEAKEHLEPFCHWGIMSL